MRNVLYRRTDENPKKIVNASKWWLFDEDGKRYLDMSSGPCCSILGHSNQEVITAIKRQLDVVPYAFSGFWTSDAAELAADMIAGIFNEQKPGWFGKVIFQNGGGETVDLTMKLAAQYHQEDHPQLKYSFASRDHCFHGVGLLPFALSDYYPRYRLIDGYHDETRHDHVVRIPHPMTDPDALEQTERTLRLYTDIAAVIIEPVGGPPIGAWPDDGGYLMGLRKLCDELDVLLIFDEILCGSGRCGALSVAELYGVWPDITILGKGLAAGYQPMSAIVISQKVLERIEKGSQTLMFGTTYGAHTAGCAAIYATLKYMRDRDLFEQSRRNGKLLGTYLKEMLRTCPVVSSVNGIGFLWGIEFCDLNKDSFPAKVQFHSRVRQNLLKDGYVYYSKGQTVDGLRDYLIVAPPIEMGWEYVEQAIKNLVKGINRTYAELENENR